MKKATNNVIKGDYKGCILTFRKNEFGKVKKCLKKGMLKTKDIVFLSKETIDNIELFSVEEIENKKTATR